MKTLLFLCSENASRSQMACALAKAQTADPDLKVISAGTSPAAEVNHYTTRVLKEIELDISDQSPNELNEETLQNADVAVALCSEAAKKTNLLLPGHPAFVSWDLPDPSLFKGPEEEAIEAFRKTRDKIQALVSDFFQHGYFETLFREKQRNELVLDNMSEGILVHDTNRIILFFNKTAEKVTGYSREEIIGKDCHDVFPQKLCGRKCSFCEPALPKSEQSTYSIKSYTKSGEVRELKMSLNGIFNSDNELAGVVASFNDLTRELSLARKLGEVEKFNGIIGKDKKMLETFELIRSVADAKAPVLVYGESGTGKELVASAIHNESIRGEHLFVPINCGALPENLLESELFGHVKGAFTGAIRDKKGRFELAHKGTIFLDEIGDISLTMQVKLLRVLQEGVFERVGSSQSIRVDVRVISATHRDLNEEIKAGRFREDLYYRICVVPISIPPLRDRRGDIPFLVEHFLKNMSKAAGRKPVNIDPAAMNTLLSYDWPGNVRELQNALQFSLVKCKNDLINPDHLPPHLIQSAFEKTVILTQNKRGRKKKLQINIVKEALIKAKGNKALAARHLGVGRATLYRFLRDHEDELAGIL